MYILVRFLISEVNVPISYMEMAGNISCQSNFEKKRTKFRRKKEGTAILLKRVEPETSVVEWPTPVA